jgi:peptidyl-prolyl cis-trans isomerase C
MRIVDRSWMRGALALALVLLLVGACGKKKEEAGGFQDTGSEIVGAPTSLLAKVDNQPVTLAEVDVLCSYWMNSRAPQLQGITNRRELQLLALNELIDQAVLAREAERRNIAVADSVVDGMLSRWTGQFADETQRTQQLAERGLTLEQVREKFRQDLLVQDLVKQAVMDTLQVSDADVATYYQTHPNDFETTEIHARHILKLVDAGAPAESLAAKRAEVEALLARVRAGEDFATLATANSDDKGSAARGGDLGYFTRTRMVPGFSEAAFALAPGQVSDVVQTQYGFHIIKVEDRRNEGTRGLADVAASVQRYLRNQKVQEAVDRLALQLRGKSRVKMLLKG